MSFKGFLPHSSSSVAAVTEDAASPLVLKIYSFRVVLFPDPYFMGTPGMAPGLSGFKALKEQYGD